MTLKLEDQFRLAELQQDFIGRCAAAVFSAAVTAFAAPALSDPVKQAQRLALVNQIVQEPSALGSTFRWICVSQASLMQVADITDTFLITITSQFFDIIAQQVIPKS